MGNLHIATIFIVTANILMWFCQLSMLNLNPAGSFCYNVEGSIIDNSVIGSGNQTVLQNEILGDLPTSEGTTVTPTDTSVSFTDVFKNILEWFKSVPGVRYLYNVIAAPYNILKCTALPNEFIVGVGTLWYLISLLVLLAFIWGRD